MSVTPNLADLFTRRQERFVNPSYRIGLNFYPLDFCPSTSFWGFLGSRRTDRARPVDWTPTKGQTDASVVRFTWDKQIGMPAAQWTASIKEGHQDLSIDWRRPDIIDGDWVDIAVLRDGRSIPLGRGVVDSVREATHSAGGATVRVWNISGRDHGAFFEVPFTWTSFYAKTLGELAAGVNTSAVRGEQGGRPDKLFQMLITAAFGPGKLAGMYEVPPSLRSKFPGAGSGEEGKKILHDILRVFPLGASKGDRTAGLRGMYFNAPRLWSEGGQSLHQSLVFWSNPLLNEVFYDLYPTSTSMPEHGLDGFVPLEPGQTVQTTPSMISDFGDIAAFIRERPFVNTIEGEDSLWFSLPTWRIPSWLIENADLGFGGHERFNLFELNVELGMASSNPQVPFCKPIWNRDSIKKWGLHPYQQTTPFYAKLDLGQELYTERKKWLRLLVDWFAPSPYLRQGTISFHVGLPELRVGQRLIIDPGLGEDQCEQFYVEGVRHEWIWPPGHMGTTVMVTHGFRGTDRAYLSQVNELSQLYDDIQEATLLGKTGSPPKTGTTLLSKAFDELLSGAGED